MFRKEVFLLLSLTCLALGKLKATNFLRLKGGLTKIFFVSLMAGNDWSNWRPEGPCSESCGQQGMRTWSRVCQGMKMIVPVHSLSYFPKLAPITGPDCPGNIMETFPCQMSDCGSLGDEEEPRCPCGVVCKECQGMYLNDKVRAEELI